MHDMPSDLERVHMQGAKTKKALQDSLFSLKVKPERSVSTSVWLFPGPSMNNRENLPCSAENELFEQA